MSTARGSLPWRGSGEYGRTAYSPTHPVARTPFSAVADLRARRGPQERERLLDERLAELRADPPRGFPVEPVSSDAGTDAGGPEASSASAGSGVTAEAVSGCG